MCNVHPLRIKAWQSNEKTLYKQHLPPTKAAVQPAVSAGLARWRPPLPSTLAELHRVAPRDLRVPAEYATVQAAVDAAKSGDRIAVAPGTHEGVIAVTGVRDGQ